MINSNIFILTGLPASGKSYVANLLATYLKYQVIDLDSYIEILYQSKITEIFENHGEETFREYEASTLKSIFDVFATKNLVLSLGGGTFCNSASQKLCDENGTTIFLNTDIDVIYKRLQNNHKNRPLFKNSVSVMDTLQNLSKARYHFYKKANIEINIDKNDISDDNSILQKIIVAIGDNDKFL